jgi:hypothetical protein
VAIAVPSNARPNVPNQTTLLAYIKELLKRVSALERATPMSSSSVGSGSFTLYNEGEIRFFLDEGTGFPGRIFAELGDSGRRFLRIYGPSTSADPAAANDSRISLEGPTPSDIARTFVYATNGLIVLESDLLLMGAANVFMDEDLITTASSPNLFMDIADDGRVMRSTSSARYKTNIQDAVVDPLDVLQLRGRTFQTKAEVAREECRSERVGVNGSISDPEENFTAPTYVGLIAEELDALPSLRQFVNYDSEGRPDSIAYDRLVVALLELMKNQQGQISDLAALLERTTEALSQLSSDHVALSSRVDALTGPKTLDER